MKPVKSGIDSISKYLRSKKEVGRRKIGLLVDGPNILRKEFDVNLEEIRDVLKDYGNIKIGRVFLNQYASDKLVEAIENHGLTDNLFQRCSCAPRGRGYGAGI